MAYNRDDLLRKEHQYWELGDGSEAMQFYQAHVDNFGTPLDQSLLEMQMGYARELGKLPVLDLEATLAILVGESFEPLLQSIWAYNPTRLIPIVNRQYGDKDPLSNDYRSGQAQWDELRRWIELLLQKPDRNKINLPQEITPVKYSPTDVYIYLRRELEEDLRDPNRRVVIDITGAKKTMVAGAFLLAANTKAEINYIDVGEYENGGERRPYGFSCEFIKVQNPLDQLLLEDWIRTERHYEQYDFSGALAALPEKVDVFGKELSSLRTFLRVCDLWDNGQLREAKEKLGELSPELRTMVPKNVGRLGGHWPEPDGDRLKESLFRDPANIIIFAEDEIERAKRRKKFGKMRSAFTRAYALIETLFKAKIIAAYMDGSVAITPVKGVSPLDFSESTPAYDAAFSWLVDKLSAAWTRNLLENGERYPLKIEPLNDLGINGKFKITTEKGIDKKYLPPDILRERRNLVTHTYYPVNAKLVDEAIDLAEQNLLDYKKTWASLHNPGLKIEQDNSPGESNSCDLLYKIITEKETISVGKNDFSVPPWDDLMKVCGLSHFLTPKNQ